MGLFFKVGGDYLVLPGVVVEADAVEAFKKLLDRHINMPGMEGSVQVDKGWSCIMFGKHRGPKGLFLCCTIQCSTIENNVYYIVVSIIGI